MALEQEDPDTLDLLDRLEAKVRDLHLAVKRLSAALDQAANPAETRPKRTRTRAGETQARPAQPVSETSKTATGKRKRQALGRGLAEIRKRPGQPKESGGTE